MLRSWVRGAVPEDFGLWGLVVAPDGLQMPVATENPFKVNSIDSSKRPFLFIAGAD